MKYNFKGKISNYLLNEVEKKIEELGEKDVGYAEGTGALLAMFPRTIETILQEYHDELMRFINENFIEKETSTIKNLEQSE